MEQARAARTYYVSGVVQGVGYRYFTRRAAVRLGLAGYVKNLLDGRVEVYAIGEQKQLAALRKELERGPQTASVAEVAEEEAELEEKYAHDFAVEHSG
ncbi:MAG TPA: acylphosphatase [Candidatus Acidoferrales bacterium]|nr:acylphosphatase [Candidatus Acidoferrales bacterium]